MPVTVALPPPWRRLIGGTKEVGTPPGRLAEVLAAVAAAHPELQSRLLDEAGWPLTTLRMLVNGRAYQPAADPEPNLGDGDRVSILVAVGGG